MSQNDFTIANQTFPSTRSDINSALQALASLSSGASAPSATFAGMFWYDTTNGVIKQRNAADNGWITLWSEDKGGFISQNGSSVYAADAGVNDSYAITLSPAPASLSTGMHVFFKANTANTGAATLNVNGLGAVTLKKNKDTDLSTGDIKSGDVLLVVYDGTNWVVKSQLNNEYDVNNRTAVTALQAADQVPFADNSDSDKTKKITVDNFRASLINDATAETTANDADTILIYDDSASAPRKMTRANFIAGSSIESYTSPAQTISSAAGGALTHGLSSTPYIIAIVLKCTDVGGDAGYAQNAEVVYLNGGPVNVTTGVTIEVDGTYISYEMGSITNPFNIHNKSTNNSATLDSTKWEMYIRAWYIA